MTPQILPVKFANVPFRKLQFGDILKKNRFACAVAAALVATSGVASAQNRNIPVPASSVGGSGVAAVAFTPMTPDDVRSMAGAGATVLPHGLPPGHYRNAATFPLMLAAVVYNRQDGSIIVNGQQVASARVRDSGTHSTMTGVVPAGATFTLNGVSPASVTALANGATWQQTGIRFGLGAVSYTATAMAAPPRMENVFECNYTGADSVSSVIVLTRPGGTCHLHHQMNRSHIFGYFQAMWVRRAGLVVDRNSYRSAGVPGTPFGGQPWSGVYSFNVNTNAGTCRGQGVQGDNWGFTSVTWQMDYAYQHPTECSVQAILDIRTCGTSPCPTPAPEIYYP